jgi:NAD(P)-dependent dehydrogenase (short-subunit alcohol dehydrogenase family)
MLPTMESEDILITGVHTGLGHALARQLLASGARVRAVSRQLPADLEGQANLRFAPLDLRRLEAIPPALDGLLEGGEALDLVLLNAGVLGEIKDLARTSLDELRAVMEINVWANKVLIDHLLAGGRRVAQIVAISSGAAFNGSGGWGAYCVSKSALNLLIRVYAHEHPQVHFTALAPGLVDTPMIRAVLDAPDDPRHAANGRIRAASAEGRVLPPDLVAAKILQRVDALRETPSGGYVDIREL